VKDISRDMRRLLAVTLRGRGLLGREVGCWVLPVTWRGAQLSILYLSCGSLQDGPVSYPKLHLPLKTLQNFFQKQLHVELTSSVHVESVEKVQGLTKENIQAVRVSPVWTCCWDRPDGLSQVKTQGRLVSPRVGLDLHHRAKLPGGLLILPPHTNHALLQLPRQSRQPGPHKLSTRDMS
jgi:hypothetical protein